MAESPPKPYEISCVIVNGRAPFSVDISPDAAIDRLKDAIKVKRQPEFDSFAADSLRLYQINISGDADLKEEVKRLLTANALNALKATYRVSKYFPEQPQDNIVNILVKPPNIGK